MNTNSLSQSLLSFLFRHRQVRCGTAANARTLHWLPMVFCALFSAASDSLTLTGVISRKTHGTAGSFDLPIDITRSIGGALTVEPRASAAGHTLLFTFDQPITSIGGYAIRDETGLDIGSASVIGGSNMVQVTLTAVPDRKRVTVHLFNVNNEQFEAVAAMGFLVGDVNITGAVDALDVAQLKSRSGQPAVVANFMYDVNLTGLTSAADIVAAKNRSGRALPAARTLGGSVSGLLGGGIMGNVVLQSNGAPDLSISSNGAFSFVPAFAQGASYNVTVRRQPTGQTCTVSNGAGTFAAASVSDIIVTCGPDPLTCATSALQALATAGTLSRDVAPQCGGSESLCCPGGVAQAMCGPLVNNLTAQAGDLPRLAVVPQTANGRIDVTMRSRLLSAAALPIGVPLAGDCLLSINSAPGTAADVKYDFSISESIAPNGTARLQFGGIVLSQLTSNDVSIGGSFACQLAAVGLTRPIGIVGLNFIEAIKAHVCNSCPCL